MTVPRRSLLDKIAIGRLAALVHPPLCGPDRRSARTGIDDGSDLFISYVRKDSRRTIAGHRVDVVADFKKACEQHHHPDDSHRRFRVCTDIDDFDLSGSLSETIARQVDSSRALLMLSSRGVPDRPVVHEEVSRFVAARPGRPLLAAYLDIQPSEAMPAYFPRGAAAVDLAPAEGATLREWRAQVLRESHKAVAWVWDLPVKRIYDRFVEMQRRQRRSVAAGVVGAVLVSLAAAVTSGGEYGLHRVAELNPAERVVSPVAVGYAGPLMAHPALVGDKSIQLWDATRQGFPFALFGRPRPPDTITIKRFTAKALFLRDGRVLLGRGRKVNVFDLDSRIETTLFEAPEDVVGLGAADRMPTEGRGRQAEDTILAVATRGGQLYLGPVILGVSFSELPRPETLLNRRFPPFQERTQVPFGPLLALSQDASWLASATEAGVLVVWNLKASAFLDPQDPIVYETHNTRPIGAMLFLPGPVPRLIFSEGSDGLRSLDLATRRVEPLSELPPLPLLRDLLLSADARTIVGASYETLEIFSVPKVGSLRWHQRIPLSPKGGPRIALAPPAESKSDQPVLVAYFDARPDIFAVTFRVFGFDLWPPPGF
jgi:hypothetical protein